MASRTPLLRSAAVGGLPSLTAAGLLLAILLPVAPAEAQYTGGYFGKNKITYREFDWQIYHSPHFDVYYYEEEAELLPKIVSFAESAYDRLSRRFDFQIQEPTSLLVYATHSAFEQNNIIVNFIPENVGAFASPVRNRMVLPADLPDPELFQLIQHELTHIFQFHILYQGNLGKALRFRPPTWVTEGMASYFGEDEQSWDQMYLRDMVVNDRVPPMTRVDVGGFLAYRLGNAAYRFMEERWGEDGIIDFIYELRNTFTAEPGPAIERAFGIDPDEFDHDFRRWLRDQYLPALVETGEPSDFGRAFRPRRSPLNQTWLSSGVASPSGDLLAAFTTTRGEIDVVLLDLRERTQVRNLTAGYSDDYQYLVAQSLSVSRRMGNDLSFSPDGDTLAVFAKRESGRSLVLIDVLEGGHRRIIDLTRRYGVEQPLSPSFTPDGRKVVFGGWLDGQFDILMLDLDTAELTKLTDDDLFDGAPDVSPDGEYVVFTSVVDEYQKLFRIRLDDPSVREQLTRGESHERDAAHSPDGRRLYFSSDRSGAENVYSVDLDTGTIVQHTDVVTGTMMPAPFTDPEGRDQVVYTGYWRGGFGLYVADPEEATEMVAELDEGEPGAQAVAEAMPEFRIELTEPEELDRFEPDIEVAIDDANREDYRGFKLYLENAQSVVAVDDDQRVLGQAVLTFSDQIGDRRVVAQFTSFSRFSDFDVVYLDSSRRLQRIARVYDYRDYFLGINREGELVRASRFQETGAVASASYPINVYHRAELGVGWVLRDVNFPGFARNRRTGEVFQVYEAQSENFPIIRGAIVGDTTHFEPWGPQAGRRWRLAADYGPSIDGGGTVSSNVLLDARQYVPLTRRSSLAFRAFGALSDGSFPRPYWVGGFDTLRGFEYRSEVGDRAFYVNSEFRFPLIDTLEFPFLRIQQMRGRVFLDVGAAWFDDAQDFDFWDSENDRLEDALSSYGFGFSTYLFGLPVNWDFSKRWDFDESEGSFRTDFWIGLRF